MYLLQYMLLLIICFLIFSTNKTTIEFVHKGVEINPILTAIVVVQPIRIDTARIPTYIEMFTSLMYTYT